MGLGNFTFVFHDDSVTLHLLVLGGSVDGLHCFFHKAVTISLALAHVSVNLVPLPQKEGKKVYIDSLKTICIHLLGVFNHRLDRRGYSMA